MADITGGEMGFNRPVGEGAMPRRVASVGGQLDNAAAGHSSNVMQTVTAAEPSYPQSELQLLQQQHQQQNRGGFLRRQESVDLDSSRRRLAAANAARPAAGRPTSAAASFGNGLNGLSTFGNGGNHHTTAATVHHNGNASIEASPGPKQQMQTRIGDG